jgi:hypothetical protein
MLSRSNPFDSTSCLSRVQQTSVFFRRTSSKPGLALTRREMLMAMAASSLTGCGAGEMAEREGVERTLTTTAANDSTGLTEPAWISDVPTISFSEGVPDAYGLRQHTQGFDMTKHTMALAADSKALPSGMSLDSTGWLRYDGSKSGVSVSGLVIDIR